MGGLATNGLCIMVTIVVHKHDFSLATAKVAFVVAIVLQVIGSSVLQVKTLKTTTTVKFLVIHILHLFTWHLCGSITIGMAIM